MISERISRRSRARKNVEEKKTLQFFAENKATFDVVLLNPARTFEAGRNEIAEALKVLTPGGVLLVNHVIADTAFAARAAAPKANPGASWKGEVWRAFYATICEMKHRFATAQTDGGIGVIDTLGDKDGDMKYNPDITWTEMDVNRVVALNEHTAAGVLAWLDAVAEKKPAKKSARKTEEPAAEVVTPSRNHADAGTVRTD